MTFGAFGGPKSGGIMRMFDPRSGVLSHSGTFNNNIVTMAAGIAGMDIYTKEEVERLNALGEKLKTSIEAVIKKHGISTPEPSTSTETQSLMSISGKGSMLAIHFSGEQAKSLLKLFWHYMLKNSIYVAPRGFMALNLELTQQHVDAFVVATELFILKYKHFFV